jgi:hypothetical protein
MKKMSLFVFLLGSVCVSNAAMGPEDALNHPKKINSEIPSRHFNHAVPPSPEDMEAYFAAQRLYSNATPDRHNSDRPLSVSQELRRCP